MLTDFITPSTNLIHLSLTGSTPETVLKDLLDKVDGLKIYDATDHLKISDNPNRNL